MSNIKARLDYDIENLDNPNSKHSIQIQNIRATLSSAELVTVLNGNQWKRVWKEGKPMPPTPSKRTVNLNLNGMQILKIIEIAIPRVSLSSIGISSKEAYK